MSIITKIVRHNYGVAKLGHTMLLFGHAYNQEKAVVIKKTGKHDKDTGSSEVQIALCRNESEELSSHLKTHKR